MQVFGKAGLVSPITGNVKECMGRGKDLLSIIIRDNCK